MTEAKHTPGPWEYVAATEHHGPYVTSAFGSTICDCYTMSHAGSASVLNGGPSRPISFMHEMADPNARLIAAAPDLLIELQAMVETFAGYQGMELNSARAAIAKATGAA
jgi:hypothetical protein